MTVLDYAIQYHRRGWNILPIAAGTKKPTCEYKHWLTTRQTEQDIRRLFVGNVGVGVILGAVSGGLYVRDFDIADAHEQWKAAHRELANTLPTAATRRGAHVYFRNTEHLRTRKFTDGELRGNGSYVVAPPTRHPEGNYYQWRIPLGAEIPIVDPLQAGFIEKTEEKNGSDCTEPTEAVSLSALCSLYNGKLDAEKIARMALPDEPHTNNDRLFHLARICTTISHQRGNELSQSELQDVFNQWYQMAVPHLRLDQSRDDYYFEFLKGLKNVKYDIGDEPLMQAWQRAKQNPLLKAAMQFENDQVRLVVALCCELQRTAGTQTFYLAGRTVARLLEHKNHTTAANWLCGLVNTKILKIAVQGGPDTNKATRYNYLPSIEVI